MHGLLLRQNLWWWDTSLGHLLWLNQLMPICRGPIAHFIYFLGCAPYFLHIFNTCPLCDSTFHDMGTYLSRFFSMCVFLGFFLSFGVNLMSVAPYYIYREKYQYVQYLITGTLPNTLTERCHIAGITRKGSNTKIYTPQNASSHACF